MPIPVQLTHRQQQVLWATVRHYIATAEPVGSKAIAEEYQLNASPATIRSTMGLLEKAGLLYQPHTSAGRVPSDSGYRVYVDRLMLAPSSQLAQRVEQLLSGKLRHNDRNLDSFLRRAAQILSSLSGYITLITLPQTNVAALRHLQLLPLESGQVMLVMVTDTYETQSIVMTLPPTVMTDDLKEDDLERELQILSNFLNEHLRGKILAELPKLNWQELDQAFQRYGDFLSLILSELSQRKQFNWPTPIVVSGVAEVLRHPEFSASQQVQIILQMLEDDQDLLWPLIFEPTELDANPLSKRVNVWIGAENPLEPMRSCALVSTVYRQGMSPVGSVSVLGPTRMVYENAIAFVEATADYLSETLS